MICSSVFNPTLVRAHELLPTNHKLRTTEKKKKKANKILKKKMLESTKGKGSREPAGRDPDGAGTPRAESQ